MTMGLPSSSLLSGRRKRFLRMFFVRFYNALQCLFDAERKQKLVSESTVPRTRFRSQRPKVVLTTTRMACSRENWEMESVDYGQAKQRGKTWGRMNFAKGVRLSDVARCVH
ncbi:hypothetical protein IFM47457_08936 [Aspergillus lentulus]|nr:hypothetical protein IFM47457_08936 [Aspergillus lentulus]